MRKVKARDYIDQRVKVIIDRPLGSVHPKHNDLKYLVNYGYIPDTISGDGEALDAYILGVDQSLDQFEGMCIAYISRHNDDDDKLIIVPDGSSLSDEEILEKTHFQEQYFKIKIFR